MSNIQEFYFVINKYSIHWRNSNSNNNETISVPRQRSTIVQNVRVNRTSSYFKVPLKWKHLIANCSGRCIQIVPVITGLNRFSVQLNVAMNSKLPGFGIQRNGAQVLRLWENGTIENLRFIFNSFLSFLFISFR